MIQTAREFVKIAYKIIPVVERAKEERWGEFSGRHGDWGRDAAL